MLLATHQCHAVGSTSMLDMTDLCVYSRHLGAGDVVSDFAEPFSVCDESVGVVGHVGA